MTGLKIKGEDGEELCPMWGDSDLQKLAGTAKRYTPEYAADTCGTHNVMSVANLQMLLGNMGVEYGGVNALRGQNNVQGTCDMGALPNVYPGHQRVTDPSLREKFEKAWGVEGLPAENGLMIPQMMEGLVDKKVRAKVTDQVPEGMVWMAFLFRETCANWLANPVFDGITMTAEYKACAVRVDKV